MFSRRFVLLAGVLVALNVTLWFAAPGLALRKAVIQQLFGPKLIRAEAIDSCGRGCTTDWRVDRGVITSITSTQVTLREADGRVQPIPVSASTTKVVHSGHRLPLSALSPRWRVAVTWPASGPAQSVDVERIPRVIR
jgi:hypothetical protein